MINEFIFWDIELKEFILMKDIPEGFGLLSNYKDKTISTFPYIGKKDINGKKIYSESSIVEFDCKIWGWNISKSKGYFQFNKFTLRYLICVPSHFGISKINFDNEYIKDLKIIDTIQENKLGLIK